MANGYTHSLIDLDKPRPSAPEFLMTASRAMGLAMHQRDEPLSAPLRKVAEKEDYRDDNIRRAKEQISLLNSMTPEEVQQEIDDRFEKQVEAWQDSRDKIDQIEERLLAIRGEVEAWDCPDEIEIIKDFALRQIDETIEHDVTSSRKYNKDRVPQKEDPKGWVATQLAYYERDLEYNEKEKREESEAINKKNAMIQTFFDSLAELEKEAAP